MTKLIFLFLLFSFSDVISTANDQPDNINTSTYKGNWNDWKKEAKQFFKNKGFKDETISHIDSLILKKKVIELDRKQPEFKLSFQEYIKKVITNDIVIKGRRNLKENVKILEKIEKEFNIPKDLITSLWGIETYFGKHTGGFDVLNSLATLAFDGRRAKFFYKELEFALMIIDKKYIDRNKLKGSWAGAIGQTQFMPSTFINYAVDFDKDGKKDLLNNKADALASGANYLSKIGWDIKKKWGEQINVSIKNNPEIIKLFKKKIYKEKFFWEKYGIKFKKKYPNDEKFRIIIPDEKSQKYFIVNKNFDVILNWNRSNYFALAVCILSDKIND